MAPSITTTHDRLLEAAGEVFADAGFREARIRDICARAGANIAAVNYHFGGKEGLYRAVLEHAECHAGGAVALDAMARLDPEDQLRAFVRGFMARMFEQGKPAWQGKLMVREMADPTEALDRVVERIIRPHWELLVEIVARVAGPGVDRESVELCAASVIGQCVLYRNCGPIIDRLSPGHRQARNDREAAQATIERTARHIADFSLGALAAMRARARADGGPA
ncbi:MAG: CerR family C-terminal domain-containing protein [Phycisphaerales bacterium]|nr:CerR family C-terminal domain-containing protein [Phycisphaerales bacterium]